MGELLLLTAIAWAAARGIESTIDEVKGRAGARHKRAAEKAAAKKDKHAKPKPTPGGVPATFGRKAAHHTARAVAPGATWGRDALTAYRDAFHGAWRAETERARARRVAEAAAKPPPEPPEPAAAAPPPAEPKTGPKPTPESAPAPEPAPPVPPVDPAGPPRLRVLTGGADTTPPTTAGSDLMAVLNSGEITNMDGLLRYLRAVASISEINAESAELIAEQDAKLAARLDAMVADLGERGVDPASVSEVAALQEQIEALSAASRRGADAALAASEAATTAHTGAQARHGGFADARADADVPAADSPYYQPEGK